MNLLISPLSQTPIYEQVRAQIKELVLSGALQAGEQLPSIRLMAKDLQIGVITVKRAYDELCAEGIAVSHAGKGVFVAEIDTHKARQFYLDMLAERLHDVIAFCEQSGISREELKAEIDQLYKGKTI